jgi:diguanylate cyclase (GGDEF)-like protein
MNLRWEIRSRSGSAATRLRRWAARSLVAEPSGLDSSLVLAVPTAAIPLHAARRPAASAALPARPREPRLQDEGAARNESRAMAARAFWPTLEKLTVVAACVDVLYFVFFLWLGVPELAWPNVSSVALYAVARILLMQGCRGAAVALVCTEFVLHAVAGTLLIGWDSGFHYQMLFLMPMIVLGVHWRRGRLLLLLSFLGYVGLDIGSELLGATNPIPEGALAVVRWTNVAIAYATFAFAAVWYLRALRSAEERIRFSALSDPLTGLANQQHFLAMAARELAHQKRTNWPVAIAVVEVAPGEPAGELPRAAADAALVRVARELRRHSRQEDIVACWARGEFVVLLTDTSLHKAVGAMQRLWRALAAAPGEGQAQPPCTVSIGISEVRPGAPLRDAFARADEALERSRTRSGPRVDAQPAQA